MSRPTKYRKICCLPQNSKFGPLEDSSNASFDLFMSLDEYETVRLIDLEGLSQLECAEQMHISRATVQRVYASARKKLAAFLVEGKQLKIKGGHYKTCKGKHPCNHDHCQRRQSRCNQD